MRKQALLSLMLTLVMLSTLAGPTNAAPPAQRMGQTYTVQIGDELWSLAEKYLGNGAAYPAIIWATNDMHLRDESFAYIKDPSLLQPGWKLQIPDAKGAETYLAHYGAAGMMPAPLSPTQKVKIVYVPLMHFAAVYVAAERGYFKDLGVEVEFEKVKSGTEAIAFLSEGKVDVGAIAVVASAWNAFNKGMDLRVVAPGGLKRMKDDPTMLLVRKDLWDSGEVRTVNQLRGRKVAMAGGPGSGGEYLVSKALGKGSLSIYDVEISEIGNPDMQLAFENKAIDAGLLGAPYADQAIQAGVAVPLAKDFAPGSMSVVFVYSGKFMKERPETAKRFMVGLMEGARALQGGNYLNDENMAAYLKYQTVTEEAVRGGYPMLYDPNLTVDIASLKDVEATHRANGRTDYQGSVDMGKVVDTSWQQYALTVLGWAKQVPPVTDVAAE